MFKVDMNYHRFFALAVLIFHATWSKHCGKVQKYTFKVQKYTFNVQKYTFEAPKNTSKYKSILSKYKSILSKCKSILSTTNFKSILSKYKSRLSKYKSILSKYKSILSKYKSILSKYKYKRILQSTKAYFQSTKVYFPSTKVKPSKYKVTFGTSGTESPELRTFLIPRGFRNLVPRASSVRTSGTEPNPSEPIEHQNLRTLGHATFWPQNLGVGNPVSWNRKTCRNPSKPGSGSWNWFPGTARPVTQNRFLEPGSFPEPPQLAQNTPKSI